MAISVMKRFTLFAHKDYREEIIAKLRTSGITEIEFVTDKDKTFTIAELKDIEQKITYLEYSINTLKEYFSQKEKIVIHRNELQNLSESYNIKSIYERLRNICAEIDTVRNSVNAFENKIQSLKPWQNLNKKLTEFRNTENIRFFFCSCKQKKFDALKENIKSNLCDVVFVQESEKGTGEIYFVVVVFVSEEKSLAETIRQLGITTYNLELIEEMPAEIISNYYKEITANQSELANLTKTMKNIAAENINKLLTLYDYYSELYKIKIAQEKLEHTQETFIIEGWIQELSEKKLKSQLNSISNAIEIYFRHPAKGEIPPIILKNTEIISPFEFLTTLFDRPQYTEFDPTPLFTPFFVVFFALCVSDIFYGIIATVSGLVGLRILSKKTGFSRNSGSFRLFKIILFCGLLTIVCGTITDSLAGFPISGFFRQAKKFILVNPLQEPMKMLIISLLLGIIQLLFGMFIKLVKNFKSKDFFGVLDQILLIVLVVSVVPLAYRIMFGKIISYEIVSISKTVFPVAGILFLVLVIGRKLITKPIDCIATVFGTWGIFGDTMSYSRIFGIALSGAAIAQIINSGVVSLTSGSYSGGVGYIFAVVLFVFGHSVNFLMNLLGAFVHSARLQFLEFFSKFFDGGGRAFQPFCEERKYTVEI